MMCVCRISNLNKDYLLTYLLMLMTVASGRERTPDDTVGDSDYLEKKTTLLLTVALCVLVVLLSVAFVCHRQWKRRQLEIKLTLSSTPAHEALLSRSDQTDNTRRQSRQQSIIAAANDSNDHSQK